ncbi:MAG: Uma2 family endonuclease [Thermoanaerobaculia bacterium]
MALLKDSERLITGEELFHSPDLGPCELVDGRIVPTMPTGRVHGKSEARLAARLLTYVENHDKGEVLTGEIGIYIRRNPDTVRAADIAFISHGRLARCKAEGYLDVAPEIVVEVLSPDDRMSRVQEKLRDYFSAGVQVVWVVDPTLRRVLVHRSLTEVTVLDDRRSLTDEDLLPGFSVPVSDLFPE